MKQLAPALLVVLCGTAAADGVTARLGMTFSPYFDETVPSSYHEVGPAVAIGERLGRFVGEAEWAYLSMFDPIASPGGVHRLGVTLRADVWRRELPSHATGLYVEAGAAERFGQWVVQPTEQVPQTSPQPEVHIGGGFEMNQTVHPHRNGWQLGVRFSEARGEDVISVACRSTTGMCINGQMPATKSGIQRSLFIEWMFLIGN